MGGERKIRAEQVEFDITRFRFEGGLASGNRGWHSGLILGGDFLSRIAGKHIVEDDQSGVAELREDAADPAGAQRRLYALVVGVGGIDRY